MREGTKTRGKDFELLRDKKLREGKYMETLIEKG